tara:strand:+ start:1652 stop:1975 length:324 start_codon:yes stop_codon:yes gene_type:complete
MTDESPEAAPASEAAPVVAGPVIRQHPVADDPIVELSVPEGSHVLDVRVIDGQTVLRTAEPSDETETETLRLRRYVIGDALEGSLTLIPGYPGGGHVFLEGRDLSPD